MTGMYDFRGQFYTITRSVTQSFGPPCPGRREARCEATCNNGCNRKFEIPLPPGDLPASRHDRHFARELNRVAGRHRCRRKLVLSKVEGRRRPHAA